MKTGFIIIALLLLACIGIYLSDRPARQELETTELELKLQKAAYEELDASYEEAITTLEQQKGINTELDSKVNVQVQQLEKQERKIYEIARDKAEIQDAIQRGNFKEVRRLNEKFRQCYLSE
ncbi:MAG: hypothetical protein M3Q34_01490 [bacterium]|nr:hypothetical protein [bacterium]